MKLRRSHQESHPAAATSLLVVTAISLVFVVITTGLTALSVRESRQALDTDLSARAQAAAEASARDAATWVTQNPGAEYPSCDGANAKGIPNGTNVKDLISYNVSSDADDQTEIVCRTVTISTQNVTQQLKKDDVTQIFTYLPKTTGANTMQLQWGKDQPDPLGNENDPYPKAWQETTPATIELTVVSMPSSGTIDPIDGLKTRTILISPSAVPKDFSPSAASGAVTGGTCGAASPQGYNCTTTINLNNLVPNANTQNIAIALKSRYIDTDFLAQFYSGSLSSTPVTVQQSRALIDVTAKVGNLYRRIQAEKPLGTNSFFTDVLYSNKNICKNIQVNTDLSLDKANNCEE